MQMSMMKLDLYLLLLYPLYTHDCAFCQSRLDQDTFRLCSSARNYNDEGSDLYYPVHNECC
jgi:hypothetical protein